MCVVVVSSFFPLTVCVWWGRVGGWVGGWWWEGGEGGLLTKTKESSDFGLKLKIRSLCKNLNRFVLYSQ